MKNKAYRVGLIGCGSISPSHVSALIEAGQTVCALCDIDTLRALRLKDKFSLESANIYADFKVMIEKERPDSVHICTPHYLHSPMIIYALDRGINVLCEKPLCITADQLEAVQAAVKKSSATLGVCHQNRYEGAMRTLKDMAEKEGVAAAFGHVVWHRDENYYRSGDWRGKWDTEGGGVMINQALHTLDIMQWICGMPDFVTAHVSNDRLKGVIEAEDTASALFEYKNAPSFNFFATTSAQEDFSVMMRLRLKSKKTVNAENHLITVNGQVVTNTTEGDVIGKSVWGSCHKALIEDFYNCLETDTPFQIGFEEAEKVIRLILSMYRSKGERFEILH